MALKTVAPGLFTTPTAPSPGVAVAQSASANTFGSYVEAIASTAAAIFITGVVISAATTQVPTYVNVQIGTGAAASEVTVGQIQLSVPFTQGGASTQFGSFVPIWPWIAVATTTRIALKTASDVASAVSWNVSLQCVNQANVIDAGISENATVIGTVTVGTNNDKTGYSLSANQTFNTTGNITGNITGSIGSVTGAVYTVMSPVVAISPRGSRI